MFIPRNQYKIKSTTGDEFVDSFGNPYVGSYIETFNGKFLPNVSKNGVVTGELQPVDQPRIAINRPYNDYYGPTENDYVTGSFIRYFVKEKSTGKFVEMSKSQWLEKKLSSFVVSGQLRWLLTGPIEDGELNGFPYKGVRSTNRGTLQQLEKSYPGIQEFFSNPIEFVR